MKRYWYLLSLVLFGCAGLPPQSDAIHHALVTDLALRQAADFCLAADDGVDITAIGERARWWTRNAWPLEVYDAVCSQDDYQLIRCEWGRCAINR